MCEVCRIQECTSVDATPNAHVQKPESNELACTMLIAFEFYGKGGGEGEGERGEGEYLIK